MMTWMFRHACGCGEEPEHSQVHLSRRWHGAALLLLGFGSSTVSHPSNPGVSSGHSTSTTNSKKQPGLNPLQNFAWCTDRSPPTTPGNVYPCNKSRRFLNLDKPQPAGTKLQPDDTASERAFSKTPQQPTWTLGVCETFSMCKSSMGGSALQPRRIFDSACVRARGCLFEPLLYPAVAARALFATIAGMPDVRLSEFATRSRRVGPASLSHHQ